MEVQKIKKQFNPDTGLVEIEDYDPQSDKFCLRLTDSHCGLLREGICDLDKYGSELRNMQFDRMLDHSKFPRCVKIFFGIRDNTITCNPPLLSNEKCGRYTFTDGQHRICVARRMGLKISVEMYLDDGGCYEIRTCNAQSVNAWVVFNGIEKVTIT